MDPIKIYIYDVINKKRIFVDSLNFIEPKNEEIIKEFDKVLYINDIEAKINFILKINFINSLLSYKKNKILKFEHENFDKKEELETLANSLSHIESTLGKYFLDNENNTNAIGNNNTNNNANNNFNENNFVNNSKILIDDIDYTEKIENYFLRIIGKKLFKWDTIIYFFNKIVFLLSICTWIYKFDVFTVRKIFLF